MFCYSKQPHYLKKCVLYVTEISRITLFMRRPVYILSFFICQNLFMSLCSLWWFLNSHESFRKMLYRRFQEYSSCSIVLKKAVPPWHCKSSSEILAVEAPSPLPSPLLQIAPTQQHLTLGDCFRQVFFVFLARPSSSAVVVHTATLTTRQPLLCVTRNDRTTRSATFQLRRFLEALVITRPSLLCTVSHFQRYIAICSMALIWDPWSCFFVMASLIYILKSLLLSDINLLQAVSVV